MVTVSPFFVVGSNHSFNLFILFKYSTSLLFTIISPDSNVIFTSDKHDVDLIGSIVSMMQKNEKRGYSVNANLYSS